jgi:quinol monooxygenase YgiN
MLYEVYASPEAFQTHWTGRSIQQVRQDTAGLQVSLTGVRCDLIE